MSTLNGVYSGTIGSQATPPEVQAEGTMEDRRIQLGSFDLCSKRVAVMCLRVIATGFVLASATVVGTVIWGAFHWTLAFAAVACVVGGIASAVISEKVKASEDPTYIDRLRREASQSNLDQTARKHGWEYIFRWGLLNPTSFAEKYRKQLKGKNVSEIISYYEKVSESVYNCSQAAHTYHVPRPKESKDQWRRDVKDLTVPEILSKFSLDQLEKYVIVDSGEISKLRELGRVHEGCVRRRLEESSRLESQVTTACEALRANWISECQNAEHTLGQPYADHAKNAARARFDEGMRMQSQLKTNGLRAIEEAFNSSVKDLNLRYRAYVRMMSS
ncbi:MAG: hypothetical protein V4492_02745 [Chlamydiota bacterium]